MFPRVAKINFVHDCSVNVRLSPLQYSDVFVNGVKCRALQDSGAQLSLISQAVCDRVKAEVCGHIQLQGVVGDPVRVPLVDVVINSRDGPDFISKAVGTEGIHIRCGVVSLVAVDHDVILTTDVIEALSQIPVASVCDMPVCVDEVNECDDSCEVNATKNVRSPSLCLLARHPRFFLIV